MINDEVCVACGSPIATGSGSMLCSECMSYEPRFDTIKTTYKEVCNNRNNIFVFVRQTYKS